MLCTDQVEHEVGHLVHADGVHAEGLAPLTVPDLKESKKTFTHAMKLLLDNMASHPGLPQMSSEQCPCPASTLHLDDSLSLAKPEHSGLHKVEHVR